jgi:hypothetical protein
MDSKFAGVDELSRDKMQFRRVRCWVMIANARRKEKFIGITFGFESNIWTASNKAVKEKGEKKPTHMCTI